MKIQTVKCPSCGAALQVPSDGNYLKCDFCGTGLIIERSENQAVLKLADEVRQALIDARKEAIAATQTAILSAPAPTNKKLPGWLIVLGIGVVFVAGLLAIALIKPPQKSLCDEPAPDWTLTLFDEYRGDLPGPTVSLADLRGKGVVLNFWASWCKPCEEEAAALEAAWRRYRDQGVVFIGVDYLDQDPAAKRYLQKFDITFANGPDLASRISKRYTIRGVPETFFIDPQGKLVGCRKIGPLVAGEIDQRIAEIMPK